MSAAAPASSTATMACSSSPTRTRTARARRRSIAIASVSRRGSCGDRTRRKTTWSMSTSGTTISTPPEQEAAGTVPERTPLPALFLVFLRLGLTSFGGPIAHLGYYREAFVVRRRWLDERAFADLVALCQFLPGPASSQVSF